MCALLWLTWPELALTRVMWVAIRVVVVPPHRGLLAHPEGLSRVHVPPNNNCSPRRPGWSPSVAGSLLPTCTGILPGKRQAQGV